MKANLMICILLFLIVMLPVTSYGQTGSVTKYSDPDEIRILSLSDIESAVKKSFTQSELCAQRKGHVKFSFGLNDAGEIEGAIVHKLSNVVIRPDKLNSLERNIRECVKFHVPIAYKSSKMAKYRRMSIGIPFRSYCLQPN